MPLPIRLHTDANNVGALIASHYGVRPKAAEAAAGAGVFGVEVREGVGYLTGSIVDEDIADILRDYGDTGFISPQGVRDIIAEGITSLRLNSGGGSVFAASEIFADIRASEIDSITVAGIAASAATMIFAAVPHRYMTPMSQFMVHRSSTFVDGNADDFAQYAEILRGVDNEFIRTAVEVYGNTAEEWEAWLSAEKWFPASEAIERGIAQAAPDGESTKDKPKAAQDILSEAARNNAISAIKRSIQLRSPAHA